MPEPVSRDPIGTRIKILRKRKGWSLSDLASKAGIARSYLYQIEQGKSKPTQDKIQDLAKALDALPSELLGEGSKVIEITPSLQRFADQVNLGSAEVQMLAQIEYRGRKPSTVREWYAIYSIIKAMLDEDEQDEVIVDNMTDENDSAVAIEHG
jgi:transcriptional regulator with XRE-family HTH domain